MNVKDLPTAELQILCKEAQTKVKNKVFAEQIKICKEARDKHKKCKEAIKQGTKTEEDLEQAQQDVVDLCQEPYYDPCFEIFRRAIDEITTDPLAFDILFHFVVQTIYCQGYGHMDPWEVFNEVWDIEILGKSGRNGNIPNATESIESGKLASIDESFINFSQLKAHIVYKIQTAIENILGGRKARAVTFPVPEPRSDNDTSDENDIGTDEQTPMEDCIKMIRERLTQQQYELLCLRYMDDMSPQEIADANPKKYKNARQVSNALYYILGLINDTETLKNCLD